MHNNKELVEAYVFMRKQGAGPDYALQELKKLRPQITVAERDDLIRQIRQWEGAEGGPNYPPIPDKTIEPWSPGAIPQIPVKITPNPRGTRQLVVQGIQQFSQGELKEIVLTVLGHEQTPIVINVEVTPEVLLGRSNRDNILLPDVDLNKHGAETLGVSRAHATIKYQDNVVTIADMGSVNHTFLNGEQLHQQEVRVLPDGSELRLGRMVMRVMFKR